MIAICCLCLEKVDQARELASRFAWPLLSEEEIQDSFEQYDYILELTEQGLQLRATEQNWQPLRIDFLALRQSSRGQQFGKSQPLAKAIGLRKQHSLSLLDATAGLGRDSFLLASLGCDVTMLEQSSVVYCLLADAMQRAVQQQEIAEIIARMHLTHIDAGQYLQALNESIDVIYLDPMFPERKKSALVKKEMQLLQGIIGHGQEDASLLESALLCDVGRVVVKRPKSAEYLSGRKPDMDITSKTHRFDVYIK